MSRHPRPETTDSLVVPSPLGPLLLTASPAGLTRLCFAGQAGVCAAAADENIATPEAERRECGQLLHLAGEQLAAYFAGRLRVFALPLDEGGTSFQRQVWQALRGIPYGRTCSYAELAAAVGRPRACRAVGNANGKNPLPIVTPCHRVIHADGGLGGYSAGLSVKRFLLALEGAVLRRA